MRDDTLTQTCSIGRAISPKTRLTHLMRSLLAMTALLTLCSGCIALPAVIVATSNRVAIEYDPKEGVRSTAALAEEICSEAGGRAQFEATEGAVAKYTCMQLTLPAVVSANPTQVAIEFDPNAGINSTRALAESKCTEVGKQIKFVSTTGNIARYECLEPVLASSQASAQPALSGPETTANSSSVLSTDKKTLRGFLTLGVPITSASISVTDGTGQQLGQAQVTVGSKGFFRVPLNASIPPKFQVRATVTSPSFHSPSTSVDLHTEETEFRSDGFDTVFLNPVTTMISVYYTQHSNLTRGDATRRVTQFLGIPPHVNPGRAGVFSDVFFSPRQFWTAAKKAGGFESVITQLIREIDRGEGRTRSFALVTPDEGGVLAVGNRKPTDLNDPKKPWYRSFWAGAAWRVVGATLRTIGNRIFRTQSLAKLDEIIGQLERLNKTVAEILNRIEEGAYHLRARDIDKAYDAIEGYTDAFEGLVIENNQYVRSGEDNEDTEKDLALRAKSLALIIEANTPGFLVMVNNELMGRDVGNEPKSLTTFWGKVSEPDRFIGDPYFDGLEDQFGYYQAMQINATYLIREAVGEGPEAGKQPEEPEECLPDNHPSNPVWMCKYVERSVEQETLLKDRKTIFNKPIPEHTVWDKAMNQMWTDRSVKGCQSAWSTHRDAAVPFDRGGYTDWRVASKEDYENLLDESEDGKGDMRPEDQPAWDYLNARGFSLAACGLKDHTNTRGYYSRDAPGDQAWVLGLDGRVELRCKHGECEMYPYQEPWKARGALFNRYHAD